MKFVILFAYLFAHSTYAAEVKIGVVDLKKALHEVEVGKQAKAKLEKEFNARKAKLDEKQKKIQEMRQDFEKKVAVLSQDARLKEGKRIESELQDYRDLLSQSQTEMQKRENELTNPILDGLEAEIKEIAKSQNLSVVLEKGQSAVVYNLSELDITEQLIKRYNSKKN